MSNGDRWLPLYVADYLGDTMHLTTLQHGAYMLLLMHYWKTGPLPDDPEALAAIAKLDATTWKTVWAKLNGFFTANGDGTLHQKRMDWERKRWASISDKRRDAGKRGAEAKHRPHPYNGSGPATTPLPTAGKTLANAKQMPEPPPVDNLAIATNLPATLPQPLPAVSGNCQDFATTFASVPVPVQRENTSLSSKSSTPREGKGTETGQDLPPTTDHLELILRESLQQANTEHKASLMSQERGRSPAAQKQAVAAKPPRAKACHIVGAHLAAARKQAGIRVAA
jgi:uncharacterized protein YdaU (DUF1376 family)